MYGPVSTPVVDISDHCHISDTIKVDVQVPPLQLC